MNVEIESTGAAGKSDFERVKKYFRLEVRKFLAYKVTFGGNRIEGFYLF